MKPMIDMTGQRFGRLVALRYSDKNDGRMAWVCQCDCGTIKEIRGFMLRQGKSKSCGCLRDEKMAAGLHRRHGQYGSPAHTSWSAMMQRCYSPNDPVYARYGGSGISVCERWHKFENFFADMGDRPQGKTLDRWPDQKGNYQPGNCRWATPTEQSNNLSNNFKVMYRGKEYTLRELSDETGVPYVTLRHRIYARGWDVDRALSEPKAKRISEEIASQIRECLARGEEQRPIAKKFGVSQGLVSQINRGVRKLRQQAA